MSHLSHDQRDPKEHEAKKREKNVCLTEESAHKAPFWIKQFRGLNWQRKIFFLLTPISFFGVQVCNPPAGYLIQWFNPVSNNDKF